MKKISFIIMIIFLSVEIIIAQNLQINSFNQSKNYLEELIYLHESERITLYCEAQFNENKEITLPIGFTTDKYKNRMNTLEWEHIVPAENFGRTFTEWNNGHADCVDSKGKTYKGRLCASKVSLEFSQMEADMYNLYPSIGAVNASRSNFNFTPLPNTSNTFGTCAMKIEERKVEPPANARGKIARAYLYMENAYPRYNMSSSQRKLMKAWNTMHPVDQAECTRTKRIEAIQGNENQIVKNLCIEESMW